MTRAASGNKKNFSTKIFGARFENDFGSADVSGENVWKKFDYFGDRPFRLFDRKG